MFILEHDKHKINVLNQYLKNKWDYVMPPPTYFHGKLIEWRSLCKEQKNDSLSPHIVKIPENFTQNLMLCIFLVGSTMAKKSFSCIRQINNWLRNSMLMDLLGYLAIIAPYMSQDSYFTNRYMQYLWESTLPGWWHLHVSASDLFYICIFSFI